ncbi:NADP-dependent oxidoreductase [Actinomadura rugatobispora]|uniref:NADP-dependent oxidoreductase n=1 Tax=Actinomadura rugatobispora TaxID=1994 RepID=A0ABW1AAZ4_9ACTN|nr:NADP-dependent oxidoreductase [Actinomadura rugatobispora]
MRAVAISELGATPVPTNLPVPEPGPGEALVRVIAAGLNPMDWKIADGLLKDSVPYHFPLILGQDGAGVVDAVGEDAAFPVGEQVFGRFFGVPRGLGTYAEYTIAAPDDAVLPMPEGMLYTQAATLPTPGMTAVAIADAAEVEAGRTVLVVGATGGVGQPVVRLASRRGATVIATARPDMAGRMRELGAAETVDHGEDELNDQIREHRPDGVDVIIDLVSDRAAAERLAALLRPGGVYASTTWALNPDALEAQDIRGVNIDYTPTPDLLRRVVELAAEGDLEIGVEEEIPLEEAPAAIARSRAGGARGKTVIRP